MKTGRNKPCPCGSGNKYKHCHGGVSNDSPRINSLSPELSRVIEMSRKKHEAAEYQRKIQQGLGKSIISTEIDGTRIVTVNNRVYQSREWKPFHDFLISYLIDTLDRDWFFSEVNKPTKEQHPIATWYVEKRIYQQTMPKDKSGIRSGKMDGSWAGFLSLAYHFYLLEHNEELQSYLLNRIKSPDRAHFYGHLHETLVFAVFIKAGYAIEFEDETDSSTTHPEITAINKISGKKFSVEAKHRQPGKDGFAIFQQMKKALVKNCNHPRIIFIEMNCPADADSGSGRPKWIGHIEGQLDKMERNLKIPKDDGVPEPAYVFLTNNPYSLYLGSDQYTPSAFLQGFKIDGFRTGHNFCLLSAMRAHREEHRDMYNLIESMKSFSNVPSTFDGGNPILMGECSGNEMKIGNYYEIDHPDLGKVPAKLLQAIASEQTGLVYCNYELSNGTHCVCTDQLNDIELAAYKMHPETYFGVLEQKHSENKDLLGWYDFFWNSYKDSPKELMLEFFAHRENIEELKQLPQKKLAEKYCETMAYSVHN